MALSEFEMIAQLLAPLAAAEGLDLRDDAALFTPRPGKQLVLTKDALTAGIHFFADDPADMIAQKLLRVNLSDLAAKGATPCGYLLALLIPESINHEWLSSFTAGLLSDQVRYGIKLYGGDTSRINGPLTLSLTAIGEVDEGTMLKRSGAQIGDVVYMTGGLGNGGLGLKIRQGELEHNDYLLQHYLRPYPRLEIGQAVASLATAAIDISDGLVQDAGHLASCSNVGITLNSSQFTFSREVRDVLNLHPNLLHYCYNCGDDYELLFTAPLSIYDDLVELSERTKTSITAIGTVDEGEGVRLLDERGERITLQQKGWQHF